MNQTEKENEKEKKGLFLDQDIFWGEGNGEGFYHVDCPFFLGFSSRVAVTDDLTGVERKIPDWPIKSLFLEELATAIRSDIKSRFGIMAFSISDTILGLWFCV